MRVHIAAPLGATPRRESRAADTRMIGRWNFSPRLVVVFAPVPMQRGSQMADSVKAKDKVENPKAQFDKPKDIVQDNALSQHEKKKALNTWEQDERQLLTASNEGMPGRDEGLQSDDGNRLDEVVRTKEEIGEKPKHKPSH
jgi:hypothetical protein